MLKIDKFYHVPLRKVHLAYLDTYGYPVRVCDDSEIYAKTCCDGDRPATQADAKYWDNFNPVVTCKRCLRWRGL